MNTLNHILQILWRRTGVPTIRIHFGCSNLGFYCKTQLQACKQLLQTCACGWFGTCPSCEPTEGSRRLRMPTRPPPPRPAKARVRHPNENPRPRRPTRRAAFLRARQESTDGPEGLPTHPAEAIRKRLGCVKLAFCEDKARQPKDFLPYQPVEPPRTHR
jgi:hypothetical protein